LFSFYILGSAAWSISEALKISRSIGSLLLKSHICIQALLSLGPWLEMAGKAASRLGYNGLIIENNPTDHWLLVAYQ
jgi:hypothetical protein